MFRLTLNQAAEILFPRPAIIGTIIGAIATLLIISSSCSDVASVASGAAGTFFGAWAGYTAGFLYNGALADWLRFKSN